jgi:hypothetical protein
LQASSVFSGSETYGFDVVATSREKLALCEDPMPGRYKRFKEDCIGVMLGVADGGFDPDLQETLLDQEKFRAYFKELRGHK